MFELIMAVQKHAEHEELAAVLDQLHQTSMNLSAYDSAQLADIQAASILL